MPGSAVPRQRMPTRLKRCAVWSFDERTFAAEAVAPRGASSKSNGSPDLPAATAGTRRRTHEVVAAVRSSLTATATRCQVPGCGPARFGASALRDGLGPIRAMLVAERADRVDHVLVPLRAAQRAPRPVRGRIAVPGGGRNGVRH